MTEAKDISVESLIGELQYLQKLLDELGETDRLMRVLGTADEGSRVDRTFGSGREHRITTKSGGWNFPSSTMAALARSPYASVILASHRDEQADAVLVQVMQIRTGLDTLIKRDVQQNARA